MADGDLTPNELALATRILEMKQININLESLTNAVYSLPEQLNDILETKEEEYMPKGRPKGSKNTSLKNLRIEVEYQNRILKNVEDLLVAKI